MKEIWISGKNLTGRETFPDSNTEIKFNVWFLTSFRKKINLLVKLYNGENLIKEWRDEARPFLWWGHKQYDYSINEQKDIYVRIEVGEYK